MKLARIDGLRHFVESLDLLYASFLRLRLSPTWAEELGRIRHWLRAAA
jgi:hypothetical protein